MSVPFCVSPSTWLKRALCPVIPLTLHSTPQPQIINNKLPDSNEAMVSSVCTSREHVTVVNVKSLL